MSRLVLSVCLICLFALGPTIAQSPSPAKSPAKTNTGDAPILTPGNVDTKNYPTTLVNFTIEKNDKDKTLFRQLEPSDIEVLVDGQPVKLGPDSLSKGKENDPIKILFMIDKSGSMKVGTDKLQAAKDALHHFIGKLDAKDEVAISTFGVDVDELLPLTEVENTAVIDRKIDEITASDANTNFYDGVLRAIEWAENTKTSNIIFLSDGKEDNEYFNRQLRSKEERDSEKARRERDLSDKMGKKGVRFFAVAIGNPSAVQTDDAFVDYDSMHNIALPTQGTADLIDMPEITAESGGNKEAAKKLIADRLKSSLTEIKKGLKFAYALKLTLPKPMPREKGEMTLNFDVGDGSNKWKLSMTYPYSVRSGVPFFEKASIGEAIFITTAISKLDYGSLSFTYLLMLVPLVILSFIPAVLNKFAAASEIRKVKDAVTSVQHGSPVIGTQCPNESGTWGKRFAFRVGDAVIVCPRCRTPHHLTCWSENKFQCMHRVCGGRYEIPAAVLAKYDVSV